MLSILLQFYDNEINSNTAHRSDTLPERQSGQTAENVISDFTSGDAHVCSTVCAQ